MRHQQQVSPKNLPDERIIRKRASRGNDRA
jgi:hypothetical protein